MSARYSVMPKEKWIGANEWRQPSSTNKQAGDKQLDGTLKDIGLKTYPAFMHHDTPLHEYADKIQEYAHRDSEASYQRLLKAGVCREQARSVLPMGQYTEAFVTANLGDWMLFLKARMDSHAQKEIQVYANAIYEILSELFPVSMEAFIDYQLSSVRFSRQEVNALRQILADKINIFDLNPEERVKLLEIHDLKSKRERVEFFSKLK